MDLPDAIDYGSPEDKWLRNAEIFLGTLLEKDEKINTDNDSIDNKILDQDLKA